MARLFKLSKSSPAPANYLWARALLFPYIRRSFRKHFHSIRLYDGEAAPWLSPEQPGPFLFFSTHAYWWDGFFELPLIQRYGLNYAIMMEKRNLERFPFFRFTGVFGIDLDTPEGRTRGLLKAVRILQAPAERRSLILYPHGRLIADGAPLPAFQSGLELLSRRVPGLTLFPVVKKIASGAYPLPEAFIRIGPPVFAREDPTATRLLGKLEETRARLEEDRLKAEPGEWILQPPRKYRGQTETPDPR